MLYRKLRKLIKHPIKFFADINKKKEATPYAGEADAPVRPVKAASVKPAKAAPVRVAPILTEAQKWDLYEEKGRKLTGLANLFPVTSLSCDHLNFWPAIRFWISFRLRLITLEGKTNLAQSKSPAGKMVLEKYWHQAYLEKKWRTTELARYETDPADFVFFANFNSIASTTMNRIHYDRLIDPVIDQVEKYGRVKKICIINSGLASLPNEYKKSRLILPGSSFVANKSYDIKYFDEFCDLLSKQIPEVQADKNNLSYFINYLMKEYAAYLEVLEKTSPKAVFFFAMDFKYPLIMAAKTLGIPCVDIQHGNMPGTYLLYNKWSELHPADKEVMLPDAFLVWGQREKEHLERVFGEVKTIVNGYRWLDFLDRLKLNKPPCSFSKFISKFKYIVLVSLSLQKTLPKILEQILLDERAGSYNIGMVVKPRPRKGEFKHDKLYDNLFYDPRLSDYPFAQLVQKVQLHLTEGSSCLMEADYHGVNTFTFGDSAHHHFPDLLDDERIVHIDSVDCFYDHFEEAVNTCRWPRLIDNSSTELDQYILSLLKNESDS